MPEITEVEVARKAVEDHCVGKKIVRAIIADDPIVVVGGGLSPSEFESSLLNKTIVAARRKGKNMWLQLDSPPFPSFQFGMAGAIYIKGVAVIKYKRSAVKDNEEWPSKYSKFFVELDDGLELSFTDKRRFARVRLLDDPTSVPPISELGPDALEEPMNLDDFFSSLRSKKIGIKALLLDQSFISGIGNWIADEVLYQARIHPMQSASSLSKENCETLLKCINEVIEKSVEVGADDSQFPSYWIYHSREKKPGKAFVDGKSIEFIKAGGRTTAYVPELQTLSGAQALKAPAKTARQASKRKKQESDGDEDSGEEDGSDKEAEDAKSKQNKDGVKKSSTRKKSIKNDDHDNDNDYEDSDIDNKKSTTRGKRAAGQAKNSRASKAPSKTKSIGNSDPDSDADNDDGDYNGNPKGTRKVTSKQQATAGNISKKKETISRNTGRVQKKSK